MISSQLGCRGGLRGEHGSNAWEKFTTSRCLSKDADRLWLIKRRIVLKGLEKMSPVGSVPKIYYLVNLSGMDNSERSRRRPPESFSWVLSRYCSTRLCIDGASQHHLRARRGSTPVLPVNGASSDGQPFLLMSEDESGVPRREKGSKNTDKWPGPDSYSHERVMARNRSQ